MASSVPDSPGFVPLAVARRRYGRRALGLGVLALLIVTLTLIAQSPPSLRGGGVILSLILIAMCVGVSALSLIWTWVIVWPTEGRRLTAAPRLHASEALAPARDETLAPLLVLVVGGLLVGALLWGLLNTVGLIGVPMLWIVSGTINLEVARKVRRAERAAQAVYYETSAAFPFKKGGRRLFVQPLSTISRQPSAVGNRPAAVQNSRTTKAKGQASSGGRKRATAGTGRVRRS